jgi:hypothetical protein
MNHGEAVNVCPWTPVGNYSAGYLQGRIVFKVAAEADNILKTLLHKGFNDFDKHLNQGFYLYSNGAGEPLVGADVGIVDGRGDKGNDTMIIGSLFSGGFRYVGNAGRVDVQR